MNQETKRRLEWVDLSRSFAIISVVLCHSVESFYSFNLDFISSLSNVSMLFVFVAFTIGRLGVPCFIFISGYLLLSRTYDSDGAKKFWKDNWVPLLITSEIWIVLYNIFLSVYNQNDFNYKTLIKNLFFIQSTDICHMWYIPMILGVYIFIPFVSTIVHKFDTKILLFPIIITFVYFFIVPVLNIVLRSTGHAGIDNLLGIEFGGTVYGLYLIIGFLFHKGTFRKINKTTSMLGFMLFFTLTVLFQLLIYKNNYEYPVWYNCGLLLITAFFLFNFFSQIKKIRFNAILYILYNLADCSFGIYLVHRPIQLVLQKFFNFDGRLSTNVLVLWITSFCISWLVVAFLGKIPKLKKLLFLLRAS